MMNCKKNKNKIVDLYALEYKWKQQYVNQKMEMEVEIRKLELVKHFQAAALLKN